MVLIELRLKQNMILVLFYCIYLIFHVVAFSLMGCFGCHEKVLLDSGATTDTQPADRCTALMHAAGSGHSQIVEVGLQVQSNHTQVLHICTGFSYILYISKEFCCGLPNRCYWPPVLVWTRQTFQVQLL